MPNVASWPGSGMNSHLFRNQWTCRMVARPIEELTKNNEKQLVVPQNSQPFLRLRGIKYCGS